MSTSEPPAPLSHACNTLSIDHSDHDQIIVNHIRKHELTNLFESRTDNTALQSHEDLSNYLKTIGKNGQKKLFEKLREHVKMPPYTNESQSGN